MAAAALPLVDAVLGIVTKVGQYLAPPIKSHFKYMCCYSKNIKDMETQEGKLDDVQTVAKLMVDAAKRNLQIIGPDVEKWLSEVDLIKEQTNKLREDTTMVPKGWICGSCPNLKLRYVLSRRATKITMKSIQLQVEGNFERVGYPPSPGKKVHYPDPPLGIDTKVMTIPVEVDMDSSSMTTETEVVPIELDNKLRSRRSIEEKIIAALQDRNVNMIGLCGMGGVGKTTMVRRIEKIIKESKMFDLVVMVVVTQQQDSGKIQNQIAEMLGLKLDGDNLWARAKRLHNRIMNEKGILVILDDIWGRLDLMEIGIPNGIVHCPCKILLTSQARDVCVQMGAHEIFSVDVLSGDEAWTLFSEEAGIIINDSSHPYPIEKEVANECKGLPIALMSVARALKGRSKASWEDALVQLKRSIPTNIPGVLANVYRPLELGYSRLEGDEAKNLFILCSLFQEDSSICIEDLVRYGLGLTIFKSIQSVREGRNRTLALIDVLKDRFLLLDGHKEGYVKMHDLFRDVAIFIRSRDEQRIMLNGNRGWRSLGDSSGECTHASVISWKSTIVPTWLNFPNLVLLLWECNNQRIEEAESTFEKLRTLKVLDIHHLDFPELPSSIQQLTNLRSLHLCHCKLGNITKIGCLVNLEILSFRGSDIKILPVELKSLDKLQLLDLADCANFEEIASGIIAGLIQLEEVYLTKSVKVDLVREFEQLCHLTTLRIVIDDRIVLSRNMDFLTKLLEYDISIGAAPRGLTEYHISATGIPFGYEPSFGKAMALFLPKPTPLGKSVNALLKSTEDLRLAGDGSSNVMLELGLGSRYLKQLRIQNCATLKYLASTSSQILPVLESLFLYKLPNIKEMCDGKLPQRSLGELRYLHLQALPKLKHFISGPVPNVSFSNLRSAYIYDCQNLESLFCISVARSLLQLEELEIANCQAMKEVLSDDDGEATNYIEFKKLNNLVLRNLNKATRLVTIDRILFPQLQQLKMEGLPRFKGFCPTKRSLVSSGDHSADSQILFNEKVACPSIKRLTLEQLNEVSKIFCHQGQGFLQGIVFLKVDSCNRLNTLFSPSTARALVNLKELRILNCGVLMELIENENKSNTNPSLQVQTPGFFRELEFLEVCGCSKMKSIFPPSVVQGLVKLKEMRVVDCKALVEVIEKDEQIKINKIPFPQLRSLQLTNLPSVERFWQTKLKIPSLHDVKVDKDSPLLETLSEIATNAKQMKAYRNSCELHGGLASVTSITPCAYCQASTSSTVYVTCKSYIRPHKEECEDDDVHLLTIK